MFGTNRRINIFETTRVVSDSGSLNEEIESQVATSVPAAIQSHVLNNLPPPTDRPTRAGLYYLRQFRCWIPTRAIPGLQPRTTWIIEDASSGERFRVKGEIDDAGRSHHWVLSLEDYDG